MNLYVCARIVGVCMYVLVYTKGIYRNLCTYIHIHAIRAYVHILAYIDKYTYKHAHTQILTCTCSTSTYIDTCTYNHAYTYLPILNNAYRIVVQIHAYTCIWGFAPVEILEYLGKCWEVKGYPRISMDIFWIFRTSFWQHIQKQYLN